MVNIIPTSGEIAEVVNHLDNVALGLDELLNRTKAEEQRIRQILDVLKKAKIVGDYVEPLCCGDDLSDFLEKIRNAKELMEIISENCRKMNA